MEAENSNRKAEVTEVLPFVRAVWARLVSVLSASLRDVALVV